VNRDAWGNFADSPGLREQIARAVEERDLRAANNDDLPAIERLLRFWRANGRKQIEFRIVR
jgi:hypothetical protein